MELVDVASAQVRFYRVSHPRSFEFFHPYAVVERVVLAFWCRFHLAPARVGDQTLQVSGELL